MGAWCLALSMLGFSCWFLPVTSNFQIYRCPGSQGQGSRPSNQAGSGRCHLSSGHKVLGKCSTQLLCVLLRLIKQGFAPDECGQQKQQLVAASLTNCYNLGKPSFFGTGCEPCQEWDHHKESMNRFHHLTLWHLMKLILSLVLHERG